MILLDLTPRAVHSDRLATLPVVIIGAGPVGLAAAANLAERGIDFVVLEAADEVAASVRLWGHTRLFSPWRHLIDPASERLLEEAGWVAPASDDAPTGAELVEAYLAPLAELEAIGSRIRFGARVVAVSREGMDRTRTAGRAQAPFLLRLRHRDGSVEDITGRAVIDASGTYTTPNPLGSSGLSPIGVEAAGDLVVHALPDVLGADRSRFTGLHTTVVGAGHSAANTLIALAELAKTAPGTRVSWLIRNASAIRVSSSPDDELENRALLGSRVDQLVATGRIDLVDGFEISTLHRGSDGVVLHGSRRGEPAQHSTDLVVNATGFRPDLDMLREVRLELDDIVEAPRRLAPLIDPNEHSCGTVEPHGFRELTHPEPGFFLVGMKSYGRAPTFLLATGYEQVRSIVAWIDGDMPAATQVELVLPATGVCSTDIGNGSSCCS
ncbi:MULTISPECIES: FAD-dependent oxidoreductase [Microbacterium]|uniref:FAD-dependent oxidoreductase n=1 Tax=Microbacterium TaxID=33882 RepID=UPI0007687808|nr:MULTISPECIES: FAD-dependent oxidoreductase [Microbacterium]KXC05590.1 flavoprotein [Microbacterium hominis]QOC24958.1 FAD-dependent oxidoreductase [Microbacterium hominis]QOC29006.1 FAD-dependent oxidoreductase [Microbacterium hominis]QYF98785.1 NAD(P)-binding domain-containing protein [Microbacterium sp. PAMC21962]